MLQTRRRGTGEPTWNHTSESAAFHDRLIFLNCYKATRKRRPAVKATHTLTHWIHTHLHTRGPVYTQILNSDLWQDCNKISIPADVVWTSTKLDYWFFSPTKYKKTINPLILITITVVPLRGPGSKISRHDARETQSRLLQLSFSAPTLILFAKTFDANWANQLFSQS